MNGIASYVCVCPAGFLGVNCEINVDECESSPCMNQGKCIDDINGYTCDCSDTGFEVEFMLSWNYIKRNFLL